MKNGIKNSEKFVQSLNAWRGMFECFLDCLNISLLNIWTPYRTFEYYIWKSECPTPCLCLFFSSKLTPGNLSCSFFKYRWHQINTYFKNYQLWSSLKLNETNKTLGSMMRLQQEMKQNCQHNTIISTKAICGEVEDVLWKKNRNW